MLATSEGTKIRRKKLKIKSTQTNIGQTMI